MDKQPGRIDRWTLLGVALFFVVCWCWFFFVAPYTLYTKEQLTLWVADRAAWLAVFERPAWLTVPLGDFLTQFYMVIGGGATLLTLVLLLLWRGGVSLLRRMGAGRNAAWIWALLPTAAEWALNCHVEYPLAMTLGAAAAMWTAAGWARIGNAAWRLVAALVLTVVVYLLVGAHYLLFTVAAATVLVSKREWWQAIIVVAVAAAVPVLLHSCFLLTAEQALFYPLIEGYMLQNMWCYLATEAALLVAILFGAAVVRLKAWIGYAVTAAALAGMLWTGFDARTEYMLRMSSEAYFNRWDRVLAAADRNWDYKSYVGSYYTDLALAREGRLGDELMKYYQPASNALLLAINEKSGYIYAMAGCDAQIEMGDLAQAQHTAMLAMTFTPRQRSSRVARRLAEIAIIAGDYELADKFLRQLEYGLFHRRWAAERRRLLADEELLSAQPEVAVKRSLLSRSDTLFSPNDWFRSLYNLLESNPSNRMARDYLMCYHLLNKDMRRFKADYDRYCFADAARAGIPKYYEQALVMCLGAEPDAVEQYVRYGVSEATYAECLDYLAAYERAGGDGRQLMERFGDSYWFYYYYAQIK